MTDADLTQRARDEAWAAALETRKRQFDRLYEHYTHAVDDAVKAAAERDALADRHDRLRAGVGHMADLMSEVWKDTRIASAKGTYGRGARDVITDTVTRLRDLLAEDGPC